MANRWENSENSEGLYFGGAPKSLQMVTAAMKLKDLLLGRKVMANLDSILKSRDIILPTKFCLVKAMVFPVVTCGCESWPIKKSWGPKNWTVVLEKTLESPLDCKDIQPVHPKGNQFWIFIGGTDTEAETPVVWPPDVKNWLIWKDPDAGKDGRWEEKQTTRGWDGWMASPTQWTWVCINSRSWWWTGVLGVLQSMGLQRVGHNWATELKWTVLGIYMWLWLPL